MRKMIRVEQPRCLALRGSEWTERYNTARRLNPAATFRWYSRACYADIRTALQATTQHHCAFCDGFIGSEGRETIEHFCPKSRFPEQAFAWENLFPCCDVCQSKKLETYHELLIKPDEEDYQFENYFICNYGSGELQPAPDASEFHRLKAEKTIEVYGLNLPVRKKARIRELKKFRAVGETMHIDEFPYRYYLAP
ncbi:hypothetical protein SD961_03440 [Erwinia sp. MMLR14_017]|uniref:hypothetical protein n=1 Tax=Erwinia sp. MMLR14_017 TaxID=3093842 RepID=UPI00298F816F|nr:hypothetical protein [Erwinia sp. MMLR14_017]MDW8844955.1 hypothetical protein [Erwinia sp. MMLR14_017]